MFLFHYFQYNQSHLVYHQYRLDQYNQYCLHFQKNRLGPVFLQGHLSLKYQLDPEDLLYQYHPVYHFGLYNLYYLHILYYRCHPFHRKCQSHLVDQLNHLHQKLRAHLSLQLPHLYHLYQRHQ